VLCEVCPDGTLCHKCGKDLSTVLQNMCRMLQRNPDECENKRREIGIDIRACTLLPYQKSPLRDSLVYYRWDMKERTKNKTVVRVCLATDSLIALCREPASVNKAFLTADISLTLPLWSCSGDVMWLFWIACAYFLVHLYPSSLTEVLSWLHMEWWRVNSKRSNAIVSHCALSNSVDNCTPLRRSAIVSSTRNITFALTMRWQHVWQSEPVSSLMPVCR
jgi:hypothetical protein